MVLVGKIEAEIEIKSSPAQFHDVISCRPHHISNITPEKVQGCDIHEGEFGTAGSTIFWSFVHDGIARTSKQIIEDINDTENSSTFKVIGGYILEEYPSMKITVKAGQKAGGTTHATYTFEYEKLNEDVPEPTAFLEYLLLVAKDIDAHLQEQA